MSKLNVVLVGGVPGVGKTTVLNKLRKTFSVIDFGKEMVSLAEKHKKLSNARWKMHDLPKKIISKLENEVIEKILRLNRKVLVEAQLIIVTGERNYYDGFPTRIYSKLPISKIAIIESSASKIKKQRVKDPSRKSELPRYQFDIVTHQRLNRTKARLLSKELNGGFKIIKGLSINARVRELIKFVLD